MHTQGRTHVDTRMSVACRCAHLVGYTWGIVLGVCAWARAKGSMFIGLGAGPDVAAVVALNAKSQNRIHTRAQIVPIRRGDIVSRDGGTPPASQRGSLRTWNPQKKPGSSPH
jgi:hypothetical protein